jgi:hypothetical protein
MLAAKKQYLHATVEDYDNIAGRRRGYPVAEPKIFP